MDGPTMIASGGSCMPGGGLLRSAMEPRGVARSVSPIGFEATMSVAMELEKDLKTESGQSEYPKSSSPEEHQANGTKDEELNLIVPKLELECEPSEEGSPTQAMEELTEEDDDVDSLCPSTTRSNGSFDGELNNSKEEMLEDEADPFQKLHNAMESNGLQVGSNGSHHALNGSGRPDSSEGDYYEGSESSQPHLYGRHPLLPRELEPGSLEVGSDDTQQLVQCSLCSFTTTSKYQLNLHLNSHYDHKCNHCDYTSRTEGRLKRHMKDFHADLPAEDFSPASVVKGDTTTPQNKVKTYRCKQCSYVATVKTDFWEHSKNHIKAEKLLTCPKCPFVTEYKHHLEYHLRNHFGSKPFKCPKCNYSCVNKSMLNSHMKSHSNIYQYRCANCTYATKYCHSLKLHLRKYAHTPSTVLNADGTPNPIPVIDVYGTRRGPRTKKTQEELYANNGSNGGGGSLPFSPVQLQGSGALSPPAFFYQGVPNGFHPNSDGGHLHRNLNHSPASGVLGGNSVGSAEEDEVTDNRRHHSSSESSPFKCNLCDFSAEQRDAFNKHMLLHAASDNHDLCSLYGINSDSLLQDPDQQQQHSQMEAVAAVATALGLNPQQQSHRADLFRHHAYSLLQMQNGQNFAFHKGSLQAQPKTQLEEPTRRSPSQLPNPLEHLRAFSEQVNVKPYMMRDFSANLFASPALTANNNAATPPTEDPPALNGSGAKISPGRQPPKVPKHNAIRVERVNHPSVDNHPSFGPLDLSSTKGGPRSQGPISLPYHVASQQQFPFVQQLQRYPAFLSQSQIAGQGALEECTNAPSPAEVSTSPNPSKSRRKGKAFKLDRICMKLHKERESPVEQLVFTDDSMEDGEVSKTSDAGEDRNTQFSPHEFTAAPDAKIATAKNDIGFESNGKPKLSPLGEGAKPKTSSPLGVTKHPGPGAPGEALASLVDTQVEAKEEDSWSEAHKCYFCDMAFKDLVMYSVHMGYHGFNNPFECNMCGQQSEDKMGFFLHIARTAHR